MLGYFWCSREQYEDGTVCPMPSVLDDLDEEFDFSNKRKVMNEQYDSIYECLVRQLTCPDKERVAKAICNQLAKNMDEAEKNSDSPYVTCPRR